MPDNKHAVLRYETIDQCLGNSRRVYHWQELLEACNDAIYERYGMIPKDWTVEPIGRNISEVDNPNVGGVEMNALQFKAGTIISKSKGDSKYHPETLEAYNIVDKGVIMLNGLNLSFDLISQRV